MRMEGITSSTLYRLDKARHGGGKMGRKLTTVGQRHEQLARLAGMEGNGMAQAILESTSRGARHRARNGLRNFTVALPETTHERIRKVRGGDTSATLIEKMLTAYEHGSVVTMTNEAANMLHTVQAKMGNGVTQLDAMRRLVEVYAHAPARASDLRFVREDVDRLTRENARLTTELLTTRQERDDALADAECERKRADELHAKNETLSRDLLFANEEIDALQGRVAGDQPIRREAVQRSQVWNVPAEGVQECLFDFVQIFSGTTAKADPSGEIVVDVPQERLPEVLPLWARATRLLGIGKKEVA